MFQHPRVLLLALAALVAAPAIALQPDAPPAAPEPAPAPSATSVFAAHAAAVGGVEKFKERKNSISEGSVASEDGKFFGLLTVWNVAPNKVSVLVDVPGTTSEHIFFNGEYGWANYPEQRARLIRGAELLDLAQSSDMYAHVEFGRVYPVAKLIGQETIKGKTYWRVEGESIYRKREVLFFDVETGLLSFIRTQVAGPDGPKAATIRLEEYKEFDGVKIPVKTRQEVEGAGPVTITIKKVRANVPESELPDFAIPQWLQQALDKAGENPEAPAAPGGR